MLQKKLNRNQALRMKGVILCLLIARTCTGEYFNLTIKEFEGRFNKAYNTLGEEEAAAINLATQEAQINVQNKKFDNGESNFEGELHPWDDLTEEEFLHQYTGLIEEEEDRDLERANNLRSINHLSRLKKKYSQLEIPEFWDSRDPALTNSPSGKCSIANYFYLTVYIPSFHHHNTLLIFVFPGQRTLSWDTKITFYFSH